MKLIPYNPYPVDIEIENNSFSNLGIDTSIW